ncbi:MAG TPA: S8 family serine peptidase, partial [Bryobacteraceae bacterium]|nr:S8 family serine peptidase [Bryobacteraceae bacterium]
MRCFAIASLVLLCSATGWSRDVHRYAVILSDPPPIRARAQGGRAAVEAARARLQPVQESMKSTLRARGFRVTGSAHTLLNAIFIDASPSDAEQIKSFPGVTQVAPMRLLHRSLDRAEQLINVPAAWNLAGGTANAGAGVKIGIIDTGIQATLPAFQDPSLTPPPGFPVCQVLFPDSAGAQWIDCTTADATKGFPLCDSATCAYTNNKVIVARSYVPVLTEADAADSRPDDPSPRDRVGHGTAVAMAAAGLTSVGPADTITGVAPKAFLGSYKVFGSSDVNDFTSGDVVIQALEDAYNDGMDVVVLSLGAPAFSGPLDRGKTCRLSFGQYCDPEASAVELAVTQARMVVVAAAGNSGANGLPLQPGFGTMNSPGDAPSAITVAATTNSHSWGNALTVSGLASYHSRFGDGPLPAGIVSGPLGDVASAGDPQACTAPPAQSLTGLFVLVERGTCTFAIKVQAVQAAGAAGVIFTNNPGDDTLLSPSGLGGTTIPAVFLGYDDGAATRAYLATNPKATVSIDSAFSAFDVTTFNQVAPFSSHGPTTGTAALKPDIAAVGVDLYLAGQTYDPNGDLYSASGFLVSQGTSFSTPQVAGIAALVKQAHPELSALQIKSSVVNTATQDLIENGSPASVLAVGAG